MSAIGSVCIEHAACATGHCGEGRCAQNAVRKPCVASTAACPAGSYCDSWTKRCQAPDWAPPAEDACHNDGDCIWGSFCTKFGRCAVRFPYGHACSKDRQCGERLACEQRHCVKRCLTREDCDNPKTWECVKRAANGLGICRARLDIPPPPDLLSLWIVLPVTSILVIFLLILGRRIWRWYRGRRAQRDIPKLSIVRSGHHSTPIIIEEHQEPAPQQTVLRQPIPTYEHFKSGRPYAHENDPVTTDTTEERPAIPADAMLSSSTGAPETIALLPSNVIPPVPAAPSRQQDPTLPIWPDMSIKLPDPFEEDIPHTPVERKEFSDPLNIAAPIHADERPPLVLPHDPSLESQSVWE